MMTYSHPAKSGCKKGLAVQNDIAEAVVFWLQKMTHPCELELCVALTLKILYKRWPIPVSYNFVLPWPWRYFTKDDPSLWATTLLPWPWRYFTKDDPSLWARTLLPWPWRYFTKDDPSLWARTLLPWPWKYFTIENQSFWMMPWLTMLHHHTKQNWTLSCKQKCQITLGVKGMWNSALSLYIYIYLF